MIRKMVLIDESKCIGCGLCANACKEKAIEIVNGKARLIRDDYCDGLGNCLPACPVDAISIIEREAAAFDEEAVKAHIAAQEKPAAGGCPGTRARMMQRAAGESAAHAPSELCQWPVQIKLVSPAAPYFRGAHLLVAADCTAYAYGSFHQDFIRGRVTLIGCTKLDDIDYSEKLAEIFRLNDVADVTVVRMEVPCCGGMERAVRRAIEQSGKNVPCAVTVISTDGRIL